jgi:hypothetical protein
MRHEIQGHDECFLATLAMLNDVSIDSVRTAVLEMTGLIVWSGANRETYQYVADMFNFPTDTWIAGPFNLPCETVPESALSGKGVIVVRFERSSHIVPFEDGIIYEPNGVLFECVEDWLEWWRNNGFVIASYKVTKL